MRDYNAKELALKIGKELGIVFTYDKYLDQYSYEKNKMKIKLSTGHWSCDSVNDGEFFKEGDPCIHLGFENIKAWSGEGRACNTVEEAIAFYRAKLDKYFTVKPKQIAEKAYGHLEQMSFAF
jgi:hypothetical protein